MFFNKNRGQFYCANCNTRFNHHFEGSLIARCPKCLSANTYTYKSYKEMQKLLLKGEKEKNE